MLWQCKCIFLLPMKLFWIWVKRVREWEREWDNSHPLTSASPLPSAAASCLAAPPSARARPPGRLALTGPAYGPSPLASPRRPEEEEEEEEAARAAVLFGRPTLGEPWREKQRDDDRETDKNRERERDKNRDRERDTRIKWHRKTGEGLGLVTVCIYTYFQLTLLFVSYGTIFYFVCLGSVTLIFHANEALWILTLTSRRG